MSDYADFLAALPPHSVALHLAHNEHRSLYQPLAQYVEDRRDRFVSEEEYEKAVATDELWELQWYPDTPVGFHVLMASTLPALLNAVVQSPQPS